MGSHYTHLKLDERCGHGTVNVTSLVERMSRFVVVMRNEDRHSKPIMEALIQGLVPLPACRSPLIAPPNFQPGSV